MEPVWRRLPDFPWDLLAPYGDRARAVPGGMVDLSVGTPVDPTPAVAAQALIESANAPGYPTVAGTLELREACAGWLNRTTGAQITESGVMPSIGSKEFIAWLPTLLGLGGEDIVVVPKIAYPTYAVGAALAGCQTIVTDATSALGPQSPSVFWLNSPSNPTGKVLGVDHLRKVVEWARDRNALVVSDECYFELGWDEEPISILHPDVCGDSHDGLLAVHSLSKRSNLAGYRFGFVAGDENVISNLIAVRKHMGMMVPAPVQSAAIAALNDDEHVVVQREVYRARREALMQALTSAGFTIEESAAGLYLWCTRGEPCWETVGTLADLGVLVTPGDFYGVAGERHIRVALTATDEQVALAAERISRTP